MTLRPKIWRLIPKRYRNAVLLVRQRRMATPGTPPDLDSEWLDGTLLSGFGHVPTFVAHAPIDSYKDGSAYRLWIRFPRGPHRRLVFKNARLDSSSYPAITGFPGQPGRPEWYVLSEPTAALASYLPKVYGVREVKPRIHHQYLLEDLSKSFHNVFDDDDAARAVSKLTAVHRALISWGEATGFNPTIDLGPGSVEEVVDFAEQALRRFADEYQDEAVRAFLGRWGEIDDLLHGSLATVRKMPSNLIHGDFNRKNVFLGSRNREAMKLVDWEWTGVGPPHADIASIMKWSPWKVQRMAVQRFFESDAEYPATVHWEVYLWCRLERSILDAALHANQNMGAAGHTSADVRIHLQRAHDVVNAMGRSAL